jgi:DNA-binding response OmpR family regulator
LTKILVVEDDEPIMRLVCLTLESEGYECVQCTDGIEGMELLAKEQPDLVILDFRIPGLDGPSFYRAARDSGFAGPILFLTALDRRDSLVEEFENRGDSTALLLKPFDPDALLQQISALLSKQTA